MARVQGFARGDFDTSFPLDDKFLALRGRLSGTDYYAAVGVYFTVLAAGWREAARKPAIRTAPDAAGVIASLVEVGLLDPEENLPRRAFDAWVGRAKRQRKVNSDRKRASRAGMSRETDADGRETDAESHDVSQVVPRESVTPQGRVGSGRAGKGKDRSEGGPGGADGLPNLTDAVALAWEAASGRSVLGSGRFAMEYLDDACRRHPEAAIVAAIEQARQDFDHIPEVSALARSVKAALDPFVIVHDRDKEEAVIAAQKAEADQHRRERLKVQTHDRGAHDGDPDPGCPKCREGAA